MNRDKRWAILMTGFIAVVAVIVILLGRLMIRLAKPPEDYTQIEVSIPTQEIKEVVAEPSWGVITLIDEPVDINSNTNRPYNITAVAINPTQSNPMAIPFSGDERVYYAYYDNFDKLKHANVYGGLKLTKQSVEELFAVPSQWGVQASITGWEDLLNHIDPIYLTVIYDYQDQGQTYTYGQKVKVTPQNVRNFLTSQRFHKHSVAELNLNGMIALSKIGDDQRIDVLLSLTQYFPATFSWERGLDILKQYNFNQPYILDTQNAVYGVVLGEGYYELYDEDQRIQTGNQLRTYLGQEVMTQSGQFDYYGTDQLTYYNPNLRVIDYPTYTQEFGGIAASEYWLRYPSLDPSITQ